MSDWEGLFDNSGSKPLSGVVVGTVTDNKDPDKLGRVKVKIPILGEESVTDWCRVATLMTGKEYGTLFIPEVGDEVLLAFHLGNAREPYVIGSLWNSNKKPPTGDVEKTRKIVSKHGHHLLFDDTAQDAKIEIKTKKGNVLNFSDKNSVLKLSDSTGQYKVEIDVESKKLTVKATASTITLSPQGDITIKGEKSVTIEGPQLTLKATASMSLEAGATLDIKTDGVLQLKGSMVKIN